MLFKTSWLKYIWKERKPFVFRQALNMVRLYRTPFKVVLHNVLEVSEENQIGYTFPLVASTALRRLDIVRLIESFGQEIASHGFNHVNYRYLPLELQRIDIARSLQVYSELGIKIQGFRAPYNMYSDGTPKLLEEFNFLWDAGIGFTKPYRMYTRFFRFTVDDKESKYMCVPLCIWSDDRMIESHRLDNVQIVKLLKLAMRRAQEKGGVIMFDLHPIRIGQLRYIDILKNIILYGEKLGGWFPTVTEAVEQWLRYNEWKDGASFCCLLTGDIDNSCFLEYLTRLF